MGAPEGCRLNLLPNKDGEAQSRTPAQVNRNCYYAGAGQPCNVTTAAARNRRGD